METNMILSGNDTSGRGVLAQWREKRMIRKQEKAKAYLQETGASPIDNIINFIKTSWLMILIVITGSVFLWRLIFKRKTGGIFRRKHNSGRSFYLRMKRAKARKAGK